MLQKPQYLLSHHISDLKHSPTRWVKTLLIAGLILFSLVIPIIPFQFQRYIKYLPALIGMGLAGLMLLRYPQLGLIGLIVASLLVPFQIGTGTGTSINVTVIIVAAVCGILILKLVSREKVLQLRWNRTYTPLLIFMVVAVIAFIAGQLPWFSFAQQKAPIPAQLGGLATYLLSFVALILVAVFVTDVRWLQWMVWIFLALACIFVVGWLIAPVGSITDRIFQRGATANSMFWTWLVALAFGQVLFNHELKRSWRIILMLLVGLTFYVAYFMVNDWKSGWLPVAAVIATLLVLRSRRIGIIVVVVAVLFSAQFINQTIASDQYSYFTRLDAWLIMLEVIKISPVIGFGPANYYWYTQLFPIRGYYVPFNSHNQYLDIVAQVGLLGLACLLWFFVEISALGWRLRTEVRHGFARGYVYSVLGGLVGTLTAAMLVDWLLPFVYNIGLNGLRGSIFAWIFMGGLIAIDFISARQNSDSGQSSPIPTVNLFKITG